MSDQAFQLDNVSLAIDGKVLLHPLDLGFRKGRITGLLGHNGSGKSTLLKLLARQMRPSGGRVLFDGAPLDRLADRAFARRVAFMPQQPPDTDELTVRELVALGRYPWHGALGRFTDHDRKTVDRALSRTGLEDFSSRVVRTLSGGERQRAMVAMLIAQDSDFLLLDEPISALDIAKQIEVMTLIRDCADQDGKTVIVVLHDVNVAARFCDDVVALAGGRLIAREPSGDLMNPEHLEAIYGIPMGIFKHPDTQAPISYVV
ncbi:ATP-binding cassette domain-containing protein [Roseibium salinum]|uniref:ATP-binding cassette domain-containing protein n=1 Tax=Roseibium salinum TaxID=1604349 RepID=A0ABT3QX58_9HYPH|nr:ATP-binding cassette domain-containing protein [Roseibium sp. DSM 29163]MCX2721421.1 ATP-binding cassette domain-containing protein [Roseibium sp. DSM 29163]